MTTVTRLLLTTTLVVSVASHAFAQQTTPRGAPASPQTSPQAPAPAAPPASTAAAPSTAPPPAVTFGILSFVQYQAQLHERDGYNAFDVTRGYLNIQAQLSNRVRFRFTPDARPTTDASLDRNLSLRLEYASLDVQTSDNVSVMFGMHETPWITFEQSINRYRVLAPMFAERLALIPGQTDLGASLRATSGRTEVHVGVYNGEGFGRAELDRYKSVNGRVTFRPFAEEDGVGDVTVSGFYQYGWYAKDRPRNVAIVMGTYENTNVVATAQFLTATDNPFIARDVERRGLSFFGEGRGGPTGWSVLGGLDLIDPDASADGDGRRRLVVGGAHWSQYAQGRLGVVMSLEQVHRSANSQLLERRLLAQTHVEF
jgi:Phosphate-selective porin O and P